MKKELEYVRNIAGAAFVDDVRKYLSDNHEERCAYTLGIVTDTKCEKTLVFKQEEPLFVFGYVLIRELRLAFDEDVDVGHIFIPLPDGKFLMCEYIQ